MCIIFPNWLKAEKIKSFNFDREFTKFVGDKLCEFSIQVKDLIFSALNQYWNIEICRTLIMLNAFLPASLVSSTKGWWPFSLKYTFYLSTENVKKADKIDAEVIFFQWGTFFNVWEKICLVSQWTILARPVWLVASNRSSIIM